MVYHRGLGLFARLGTRGGRFYPFPASSMPYSRLDMHLRKVLYFNTVFGLTLPKEFTASLGVKKGDYFEAFLRDGKTIVLKKHGVKPQRLTGAD